MLVDFFFKSRLEGALTRQWRQQWDILTVKGVLILIYYFFLSPLNVEKMWISVLKSCSFLGLKKKKVSKYVPKRGSGSALPGAPLPSWCSRAAGPRSWSWSWCRSRSWSWAQPRNPWSAGKQQVQFCLTRTVISSLSDREEGHAHLKSDWNTLRGERARRGGGGGPGGARGSQWSAVSRSCSIRLISKLGRGGVDTLIYYPNVALH